MLHHAMTMQLLTHRAQIREESHPPGRAHSKLHECTRWTSIIMLQTEKLRGSVSNPCTSSQHGSSCMAVGGQQWDSMQRAPLLACTHVPRCPDVPHHVPQGCGADLARSAWADSACKKRKHSHCLVRARCLRVSGRGYCLPQYVLIPVERKEEGQLWCQVHSKESDTHSWAYLLKA